MSIDILPGDSFGRAHPMFRRTPAQMVGYLVTLRAQIARESEARRAILTSEFCNGNAEVALRLIRETVDMVDPYNLDERAAAALNMADAIAHDEAVIREVELMERMFSEESDPSREIQISWGILHFAMSTYRPIRRQRFIAGMDGLGGHVGAIAMNPVLGRGRGGLHTMGGGYVEQKPIGLDQVLAKLV